MLSASATLLVVPILAFASVVLAALAISGAMARRERLRQRFGTTAPLAATVEEDIEPPLPPWLRIDPARFGLDRAAQRRLRGELVRAGFFDRGSVAAFVMWRLALLVILPLLGYIALTGTMSGWGTVPKFGVAGLLLIIAYYLPGAYVSRRQRLLQTKYRLVFPDFLDMLVVCINAGLSLEAALGRVAMEMGASEEELRTNLDLMAGEMRAGKSTSDALRDLAGRLGLTEARSLAALLQQTIELGTDLALALTVFADEMRDRRMARAEEKAASLPPKLTLPLGLFIFPVVLIVVLTPAVLKILRTISP